MKKQCIFRFVFLALLGPVLFMSIPFGSSAGEPHGSSQQVKKEIPIEDFLKRIPGKDAQWALNKQRDRRDRPEYILELIGVKPGMRVGEAGAGAGYFTFFLSAQVGESGVVYANDNDKYMLGAGILRQGIFRRAEKYRPGPGGG
jgi:hypothetical protein